MTRNFAGMLVVAVLCSSLVAMAEPPPPPPPPPPAESEDVGISNSSGSQSTFRQTGGLLDGSGGHVRPTMLSFFLGLPYGGYGYYGGGFGGFPLGLGARFYIPIVHDGFIPPVNDSFGIEFGADLNLLFYGNVLFAFSLPVEFRWNFHLLPKLEVYAKLGFGIGFAAYNVLYVYPYPISEVGVLYQVTDAIALRAEVGYPAVKIGIGIAF